MHEVKKVEKLKKLKYKNALEIALCRLAAQGRVFYV